MRKFVLVAAVCLGAWIPLWAQSSTQVIQWLTQLQVLASELNAAEGRSQVEGLAFELRALYRDTQAYGVAIKPPPATSDKAELLAFISALREALEQRERERPGGAFHLGRIEVNVTAEAPQIATATVVDESLYMARNVHSLTDALAVVPGVSLQRLGQRNERAIYIRGHDVRHTPVYVDGIPVYIPYDGYLDLDRFTALGISEIQVAKGFTSPLYGPNAVAGAVNLISKAPIHPLDLELATGYASGRQVHGLANLGVRRQRLWFQGTYAWLSQDSYPLSARFQPVPLQPGGWRKNAYHTDNVFRGRFAWTPRDTEHYSFTYLNQQAEKGQPPYAGNDPGVRIRYWQWPQWDRKDYYLVAHKGLGASSYLRARLYLDKFDNVVKAFDDARYSTQASRSAFTSRYDDLTYGAMTELGSRAPARQTIKAALFFKDDTHREGNLGDPMRSFRDQTFSLGAEDTIRLSARTSAVFGGSLDYLTTRNAEDFQQGRILPFPLGSLWAWNTQAGLFFAASETTRLHLTFARKTRLPTMKDRFSYRLGTSRPNPYLRPEAAGNWELGYWQLLPRNTSIELALFAHRISGTLERFYVEPNVFQLRNLGKARHLGAELGLRSNPFSRLTLLAAYTYLSRKNLWDPALPALGTPRHRLYSAAALKPLSRLTLLGEAQVESARFDYNDAGRLWRSAPFTVAGLGFSLQLARQAELQAGLQNLFDRDYRLLDGYPEPGRSAYVSLRYHF